MADGKKEPAPFAITIGRQFGSGGRELGRLIASRLGIDYYDKELLIESARLAGVNPEFSKKRRTVPDVSQRTFLILNGLLADGILYRLLGNKRRRTL